MIWLPLGRIAISPPCSLIRVRPPPKSFVPLAWPCTGVEVTLPVLIVMLPTLLMAFFSFCSSVIVADTALAAAVFMRSHALSACAAIAP